MLGFAGLLLSMFCWVVGVVAGLSGCVTDARLFSSDGLTAVVPALWMLWVFAENSSAAIFFFSDRVKISQHTGSLPERFPVRFDFFSVSGS